ncbi:MAG TPA: hypothetical protein VI197_26240 [Polyangiaceae bacterium]
MQTRSSHLDTNSNPASARGKHSVKLGPPGVWDRDPLEDATGAMLLTPLPDALAHDEILVRAWVGNTTRIGAPLVAELYLAGIDPWDNEVRAWLGHVGQWTLSRTSSGAIMHCWVEELDLRHPSRLVKHVEELVRSVRARLEAYEGLAQPTSVPSDHAAGHQRIEELWTAYKASQSQGQGARVPAELVELSMRVARHEARRLRPNIPEHCDPSDIEARAVLSVFDSFDQAARSNAEALVPRIRRGVRWVVLDELHGEAQLTQEERALLGIDSLKVSLEDIESNEHNADSGSGRAPWVDDDSVLRPSEPPASNPRWVPCDHLSNNGK